MIPLPLLSLKTYGYAALAIALVVAGVKIWMWRGQYDEAIALKSAVKKVEVKNEIRNRPRDVDALTKRLHLGKPRF